MARFSVLIFALALLLSSADGWAYDKNGRFATHENETCGFYLDAYSRATLMGGSTMKGPTKAWMVSGWISGYLTAYNGHVANGKEGILGGMTINDAMRWMAAWCRDNPSKKIYDAAAALTSKLER